MSLISELKRRNVFQVSMAYTVVAWLLMQVADILLPAFDAPEWIMRGLILLLLIGFPIAVVLAWVFDMTPKGIQRTDVMRVTGEAPPVRSRTLNIVIIGVLAAAVVLFTLDKFIWKTDLESDSGGRSSGKISVAVLPFTNMSGDTANDPFTSGMHDDLLTQLSRISAIETASRTSVRRYRDSDHSIPEIAHELNVNTVVEGGVQRSADRLRINVQLIDGISDKHMWAETYDRQLTASNIFAIQSEIAKAIVLSLQATLLPNEVLAIDKVPTESLAAYDAYVEARHNLNIRAAANLEIAVQKFQLATHLDPAFAAAWAGHCEAQRARYLLTSDQAYFEDAERACIKALSLEPDRVEVLIALGGLYRSFGEYSKAEESLQRAQLAKAEQTLKQALSLDGLEADAHIEMGQVYAMQNRLVEAEAELLHAIRISPENWEGHRSLFNFYYQYDNSPDRFEKAVREARKAVELEPDIAINWNNLGAAHFMLQDYEAASEAWGRSLKIEPTRTAYTNTGIALFYAQRYSESAEMQRKASKLAPDDHRAWGRLGDALRFVDGKTDDAEQAYLTAIPLARKILSVNDQDWKTWGLLATYLAHSGQNTDAVDAAGRALELSDRRAEALYYAAQVLGANGDTGQLLDILEETVGKDANYRHLVAIEPGFAGVESEPRFQKIIRE
jgi:TolB-like protein/Flp pilus assembly protein TadD